MNLAGHMGRIWWFWFQIQNGVCRQVPQLWQNEGSSERAQHISWSHIVSCDFPIPTPELQPLTYTTTPTGLGIVGTRRNTVLNNRPGWITMARSNFVCDFLLSIHTSSYEQFCCIYHVTWHLLKVFWWSFGAMIFICSNLWDKAQNDFLHGNLVGVGHCYAWQVWVPYFVHVIV